MSMTAIIGTSAAKSIYDSPAQRNPLQAFARGIFFLGCAVLPLNAVRLGPLTISDALFLITPMLAYLILEPETLRPLPRVQVAVWLLSLGVIISTFHSRDTTDALLVGCRVIFLWTLWLWSARILLRNLRDLSTAILLFCLGAAVSVIVAIGQVVFQLEILGVELSHNRSPGLQFHPNGQGGLLAAALPLAFAFFIAGKRRGLFATLSLLFVVGLILAGTVSGMLGAACGILVIFIRRRLSIWSLVGLMSLLGIVWWLSLNITDFFPNAPSPVERFLDTTGQGQGESTLGSRLESIRYAVDRIWENPVMGYGLDSASVVEFRKGIETHNFFLHTWVQGGAFALAAVLCMLRASFVALRERVPEKEVALKDGIIASMIALLFFSMSGPVLYERWFWFPFLLALVLPSAAKPLRDPKGTIREEAGMP